MVIVTILSTSITSSLMMRPISIFSSIAGNKIYLLFAYPVANVKIVIILLMNLTRFAIYSDKINRYENTAVT